MDGESLRARLARQADLPVPEAIKLMTEVCDALAYAHERGIVHRDIRPDEEQQRVGVPVPPGGAAGRGAPLAAQRRFELSNTAAASDKCSRRLGSLPNWNTLQINGRVDPP